MTILRGLFFLLLTAAAIGFALHNDQAVALQYYFGWISMPLPLFLWAFLFFFIGLVVSGALAALSKIGLKARIRHHQKLLAELEQKRRTLRMEPPSPEVQPR